MYHYTECGLDYVYLANGFETHDDQTYGAGVAIEDIEGLHQAIARFIIRNKRRLDGKELRFLRTELDLSQANLARLLDVSPQAVARWEKGQSEVQPSADRLIRLLYEEQQSGNQDVRKLLDCLAEIDVLVSEKSVFTETGKGWRLAA